MADENEAMRELLLLRSLYMILNRTCYLMADMSLMEYCLVCTVKEHPAGFPVKAFRTELATVSTLDYYENQVLSKELVRRVRDAGDHRALAFSITDKGASLVDRMDAEMAIALLEHFPRFTETDFQQIAELMADFGRRMDPDAVCTTIFPAGVLKALNAYRNIAATETSRRSVTFLNLCIFCLAGLNGNTISVASAARHMDTPVALFEHNLLSLEERGLMEFADDGRVIVLTETGQQRFRLLLGRIASRFSALVVSHHTEEPYTALKRYLLYLMG
ncbi:MAG: hypothetical protein IKD70_03620 [Eggerthellaceae bacterium]|nr:hypothetical protein [Eggerthellaceae bacterium]